MVLNPVLTKMLKKLSNNCLPILRRCVKSKVYSSRGSRNIFKKLFFCHPLKGCLCKTKTPLHTFIWTCSLKINCSVSVYSWMSLYTISDAIELIHSVYLKIISEVNSTLYKGLKCATHNTFIPRTFAPVSIYRKQKYHNNYITYKCISLMDVALIDVAQYQQ